MKKKNSYLENQKMYLKNKKMSNEAYLKQILGTKYKNEEDKFISRTEKRIVKEINDNNLELKRKNDAKIKFLRENKEIKKLSYVNTDFNNYNMNNQNKRNFNIEDNKLSSNYLLSSNNFNIKKLKKSYVGN